MYYVRKKKTFVLKVRKQSAVMCYKLSEVLDEKSANMTLLAYEEKKRSNFNTRKREDNHVINS